MIVNGEEIFIINCETDNHKKIIYAPLRSYIALVNKEIAKLIVDDEPSKIKHSFFERIAERQVLDMKEIINQMNNATPELSLAITDDCNLRCIYCHASAGEPDKRSSMSFNVIESVLEIYFNSIEPSQFVKISFNGGGEPTLEFEKLKFAIDKAKELASHISARCIFSMATNGCYGNTIRDYIVHNFHNISLSCDGPAFIHDRHRPIANGKGSFQFVFNTAKYFCEMKFPFAFRATVSKFSLPYLHEIVDFFSDHFPGKSLGLEHLNPFGRALQCLDSVVVPPDKEAFGDKIIDLLKYTKNKPIQILNSASTEYDIIRPVFCSNVGIPNWTVSTNGDIVACGRDDVPEQFIFGYYDIPHKTIIIDHGKVNNLRNMNILSYEDCKDCFCKYHCAGDCPDRRLTDKCDCDSVRKIGQHILNDKILAS